MNGSTGEMFSRIAERYDFMNHMMSFGLDMVWRNKLVSVAKPREEDFIADIATGTGGVAFEFAKKGGSKVVGVDVSEAMLELAREKAKRKKLEHLVEFRRVDALSLSFPSETFDIVTMAFGIRNLPDYEKGLREMIRVAKRGGKILILEFFLPTNFFVRFVYKLYLKVVIPFLGALFSERNAYEYLWRSVEEFTRDIDITELMRSAGLREVTHVPLTFGITCLYIGQKSMS